MRNETSEIVLSMQDLREVTSYAAESAQEVLEIFERAHPADSRPRDAIDADGHSFAVAGAGRRCVTPHGRRTRRPEMQTPLPWATRRGKPSFCASRMKRRRLSCASS